MQNPSLSNHFKKRKPSSIRQAQIKFSNREDRKKVKVINLAIGNVSLPIHPSMRKRMESLSNNDTIAKGKIPYTSTMGLEETRNAFLKAISSLDIDISNLFTSITDGGSSAMEIMLLGVCGPSSKQPIMLLDPAYTNYLQFCKRLDIPVLSTDRILTDNGTFAPLNFDKILEIYNSNQSNFTLNINFYKSGLATIKKMNNNKLNNQKTIINRMGTLKNIVKKYFYAPRATRKERGEYNDHPTPKPISLMRYLVRIYTPKNGIVLDPYMGSGSTGIGAIQEQRSFVGVDNNQHYVDIAQKRIKEHCEDTNFEKLFDYE